MEMREHVINVLPDSSECAMHIPNEYLFRLTCSNVYIYGFKSLCVLVPISLILHKRTLTGTF